jgi:hypothetical protein
LGERNKGCETDEVYIMDIMGESEKPLRTGLRAIIVDATVAPRAEPNPVTAATVDTPRPHHGEGGKVHGQPQRRFG